jgi:hypothetical protein
MIKVTLEFNLSNPNDKLEFTRYSKSLEMALLLDHIQNGFVFRNVVTDKDSQAYIDGVEDTIAQIKRMMKDYEINLKDII